MKREDDIKVFTPLLYELIFRGLQDEKRITQEQTILFQNNFCRNEFIIGWWSKKKKKKKKKKKLNSPN